MNGKHNIIVIPLIGLVLMLGACVPLPAITAATPNVSPTDTATFTLQPTATAIPSTATATSAPTATATPEPSPTPNQDITYAVIGDYGNGGQAEADVAALVHNWSPDFIITVGDNNYPLGAADTIDSNIGRFYHDFIYPYHGAYGPGASENRFFPSLGNHDWYSDHANPYLDYFRLPGNERYYDFVWGPVHFFALDSDEHEPDGVNSGSVQAAWLKHAMQVSTSAWNVVYFHYPPYSSGMHGSTTWMRWPFAAWGASAVLSGHDHSYERLLLDGIPYFVDGTGGGGLYSFFNVLPESQFRYNANYGAMLVHASPTDLLFEFYSRTGKLVDHYELQK